MTLPELHLSDWRATKDTLHLYSQIVGKIRLATTPPRNHWWNVPLYVDVRGLTTRRLHHRDTTFEITIDFLDHALVVGTADGRTRSFPLGDGLPVADFDTQLHAGLGELGVDVEIKEQPYRVPMTTPFAQDLEHQSWDREFVQRFGRILDWSDSVFEEFSGWFNGKTSPVHLFWHGLDLAVTRFSGRPGGPLDADPVTQEAYSHEVISFGFWPGDDNVPDAAYYSYTAPEPPGLRDQPLALGSWIPSGSSSSLAVFRTKPSGRQPIQERRCSPSARAPTRPAPASPAGTRPASTRNGARLPANFGNSKPPLPLTSAVRALGRDVHRPVPRRPAAGN